MNSARRWLGLWLALGPVGCGSLLGLDDLEYRDGNGGAAGSAGASGTTGVVCDPSPLAVSAIDPPNLDVDFEPEPAVGVRVNAAQFGTPRVRLTDESDGSQCAPAHPEPLSPDAEHVAYVCTAGSGFELRVMDLASDMTPTARRTIPPLPGGATPTYEASWDGDGALFVHDGRLLSRFDLATSSHEVIHDFTASLSGAVLESMSASDDRELFAFVARLDSTTSYFTWHRPSGERVVFPFDDAEQVSLSPNGSYLVASRDDGLRVHDLSAPSLEGTTLGIGSPDFAPDQSWGVISGDAFVGGVSETGPSPPVPTILSRQLSAPGATQSLIDFPAGSAGVVHLGASSGLPGWVAVTRFNGSSSTLSGEVFLLSHEHTMRRLALHAWTSSPARPTPYLSRNGCALVHPSNWGGVATHLYLLDLR